MRIIITEKQEKALMNYLLKEAEGEQNLIVFKFLDDNFVRGSYTQDVNGRPTNAETVVWLDSKKQPYKTITLDRLFYVLQDEFKSLTSDTKARDERLKKVMNAWINKKYNKETGNILP